MNSLLEVVNLWENRGLKILLIFHRIKISPIEHAGQYMYVLNMEGHRGFS